MTVLRTVPPANLKVIVEQCGQSLTVTVTVPGSRPGGPATADAQAGTGQGDSRDDTVAGRGSRGRRRALSLPDSRGLSPGRGHCRQ